MTDHHDRHVAIVFYEFSSDPSMLAQQAGYDDVEFLKIGDAAGRWASKHNRITWRFPIFNDETWDDGVEGLINALGGLDRVQSLLHLVAPRAAWFRIALPAKASPWQESGGLSLTSIQQLAQLQLEFDVSIFEYDQDRPTHGLKPDLG